MTRKIILAAMLTFPLIAAQPLSERIMHTDPATRRTSKVHAGAGNMQIGSLLESGSLDTNLYFVHNGIIPPKSGIGHHFHNDCEEMFIIFDGEAQFTIDGRTSLLKGPAGAPCRRGHSHAVYNPTDKPVQWMNINVSLVKGAYDAFDLADSRNDVQLDPIPTFMTMRLDRALLGKITNMYAGTGTVEFRRALGTSTFAGPWAYVDHLVIPPGAVTGSHLHREVAEVYFVMSGEGSVTLSDAAARVPVPAETATIRAGDAIPIQLLELHSFKNTGSEPLELMITGISRDETKRVDVVNAADVPPRARR